MIAEYNHFLDQHFNIVEFYNPVTKQKVVILYTEIMFPPRTSLEDISFITVNGVDVTEFLEKEGLYSRDNLVNFNTNFTAFLQKTKPWISKFSNHWTYRVIS